MLTSDEFDVRLDDVTDTVFAKVLHKKAALVHCLLYKRPSDDVMKKNLVCFHSYTDSEPLYLSVE